jgi:hypothetical protein
MANRPGLGLGSRTSGVGVDVGGARVGVGPAVGAALGSAVGEVEAPDVGGADGGAVKAG